MYIFVINKSLKIRLIVKKLYLNFKLYLSFSCKFETKIPQVKCLKSLKFSLTKDTVIMISEKRNTFKAIYLYLKRIIRKYLYNKNFRYFIVDFVR